MPEDSANTSSANEWSFLDESAGSPFVHSEEVLNDDGTFGDESISSDSNATSEGGDESKGATSSDSTSTTEPATDSKEDPTGSEAAGDGKKTTPTIAELDELYQKAKQFAEFDEALRTDPSKVIQAIMEGLDPKSREALVSSIAPAPAPNVPEFDISNYAPQNELEEAIKDRWHLLNEVPALQQQSRKGAEESMRRDQLMVPHIENANIMSEVALVQIGALCQLLGIDLPLPDVDTIRKGVGDRSYRDAVRQHVNYDTVVKTAKQRTAPRPNTPGSSSKRPEPIPQGTSMVDIARRMGTIK